MLQSLDSDDKSSPCVSTSARDSRTQIDGGSQTIPVAANVEKLVVIVVVVAVINMTEWRKNASPSYHQQDKNNNNNNKKPTTARC